MPQRKSPARADSIIAWIADTVHHRGLFGAIRSYAAGAANLLRDLTPQRRRSRYGDIDYDFDHGVDTSWATVSLRTRMRELLAGAQYQASDPELFHEILQALPVSPDGFTFIDLGSGKGRTLLMASDYAFRRIIGIELLDELNQVAQRNIQQYGSARQRCFNIESFMADARGFEFPREPLVLYLFNPFPKYVLCSVLRNLQLSFESSSRDLYVIYHKLIYEDVLRSQPWLTELRRTHQFAVYKAG